MIKGRSGMFGRMKQFVRETAQAWRALALTVLALGPLLCTVGAPRGPARAADPGAEAALKASIDSSAACPGLLRYSPWWRSAGALCGMIQAMPEKQSRQRS
jgi:hypothetical protein